MRRQHCRLPRSQAAHESTVGRGLFVWIALYLLLTLAFVLFDRPVGHQAIATLHTTHPKGQIETAPVPGATAPAVPPAIRAADKGA